MTSFVFKTKPHKVYYKLRHSVISDGKMDRWMRKHLRMPSNLGEMHGTGGRGKGDLLLSVFLAF